jgi:hypothetical protein
MSDMRRREFIALIGGLAVAQTRSALKKTQGELLRSS